MKARLKALFTEEVYQDKNGVFVDLRLWSNGETADAVLETHVQTEGQSDVHETTVLLFEEESFLIRCAIAAFDKLVAEHPVLGKKQADN